MAKFTGNYNVNGLLGGAGSTKQIAAAFTGGGMTEQNVIDMTDIVNTYMTGIGANVFDNAMWLILLLIPNIRRRENEYKIAA